MEVFLKKPDGEIYGPVPLDDLCAWAEEGRVSPDDLVSPDKEEWSPSHQLEELAMEGRDEFLEAGGEHYRYIPCLNDDDAHIAMMMAIIEQELKRFLADGPTAEELQRMQTRINASTVRGLEQTGAEPPTGQQSLLGKLQASQHVVQPTGAFVTIQHLSPGYLF